MIHLCVAIVLRILGNPLDKAFQSEQRYDEEMTQGMYAPRALTVYFNIAYRLHLSVCLSPGQMKAGQAWMPWNTMLFSNLLIVILMSCEKAVSTLSDRKLELQLASLLHTLTVVILQSCYPSRQSQIIDCTVHPVRHTWNSTDDIRSEPYVLIMVYRIKSNENRATLSTSRACMTDMPPCFRL